MWVKQDVNSVLDMYGNIREILKHSFAQQTVNINFSFVIDFLKSHSLLISVFFGFSHFRKKMLSSTCGQVFICVGESQTSARFLVDFSPLTVNRSVCV